MASFFLRSRVVLRGPLLVMSEYSIDLCLDLMVGVGIPVVYKI